MMNTDNERQKMVGADPLSIRNMGNKSRALQHAINESTKKEIQRAKSTTHLQGHL